MYTVTAQPRICADLIHFLGVTTSMSSQRTTLLISEMSRQDGRLLKALFMPAFNSPSHTDVRIDEAKRLWSSSLCANPDAVLLDAMPALAEFYEKINPVLSASIWATWNCCSYFRWQKSKLLLVFQGRSSQERFYSHYSALLATAVLQFADGDPSVGSLRVTSEEELARYGKLVERAIGKLNVISSIGD